MFSCHARPARALIQHNNFSLAMAMTWATWIHHSRGEVQAAQERAEATIALTTDQGFPFYLAVGIILRGWALAEQGQAEEGVGQMRQGMAAYWATGAGLGRSYWLALLAEAYGKGGQAEEGLTVLAEALEVVHKTGEHRFEAELMKLKGELTLQARVSGPGATVEAEAEECFQKAIEIARHQQVKSLELRAVMSLSRLWQQQSKSSEAHTLLSEIYGWFTEGFETKDLQDAKALLAELAEEH